MTTYWAPLLHIYQPPTQDIKILRVINKECYKPLFSILEQQDNAKFTLNINGVLIEMLYDYVSETHGAVHVVMLKVCHICHMFGVESTQSYQLTEFR